MKIGIIGAGHIGSALAQDFIAVGHSVLIANSRGAESLRELVDRLGPQAQAVSAREAAEQSDVVVETIPLGKVPELAELPLAGKVVIDTANYYPQRDGQIDFGGGSQGQWVARQLPGAQVVKAFNSIQAKDLASLGDPSKALSERRAIFVASDDESAKQAVMALVAQIGFAPVDSGTLADSAVHESGAALYGQALTGQQAQDALKKG